MRPRFLMGLLSLQQQIELMTSINCFCLHWDPCLGTQCLWGHYFVCLTYYFPLKSLRCSYLPCSILPIVSPHAVSSQVLRFVPITILHLQRVPCYLQMWTFHYVHILPQITHKYSKEHQSPNGWGEGDYCFVSCLLGCHVLLRTKCCHVFSPHP